MKQKGFTLIELLVVISIIGLLSSVVMTSLSAARQKAQIAKFKQEMNSLRSALELYKSDNGNYPDSVTDLNLQTLATQLSAYLKKTPDIPVLLYDTTPPTYTRIDRYIEQYTIGSCGNSSGGEGYIIWFYPKTNDIKSQFPILFENGNNTGWNCAFIPPK